jgi:hypothetical protein
MSDTELLALPKIRPEHAAKYLQSGVTAQEIRVKAQMGLCPFCRAEKPTGRRYAYRINVGQLMACKRGELGTW